MANIITQINQNLSEEDQHKIKVVLSMKKFDYLVETFKKSICETYQKIYESSTKQTFRTFFAERIGEIKRDNDSYGINDVLPEEDIKKIQAGLLKYNIRGFIANCKDVDELILNYSIEKNVPALRYDEQEKTWNEVTTTLIRFETTRKKYLYVSALNTLKSEASAKYYLERIKNYYFNSNNIIA